MAAHHCDTDLSGQNLGGLTLTPATYCFSGNATLDGLLTLDAQGNNRENFVFQVGASLITSTNAGIRIINNGESCNVLWQVTDSVSFAANTNFIGGIIAMGNVDFENESKLNGKIMSQGGSISINSSEIYNNFCPWW
jgi:type VI secretion system secreted protein VgrG